MAWKIDRDYLEPAGSFRSNVGRQSVEDFNPDLPRYRFRLRDDDGIVYYGGAFDLAHEDEDDKHWESSPLGCWKWGTYDSGTTDFEVHAKDSIASGLISEEYAEKINAKNDGWVSIYG